MNKNEFLNVVNEKSGLSKRDCKLCLETMLDVIKYALAKGESVTLTNFGKFKVNEVGAKTMYNFKTKTNELVQAKRAPTFKASDNLKQCIK